MFSKVTPIKIISSLKVLLSLNGLFGGLIKVHRVFSSHCFFSPDFMGRSVSLMRSKSKTLVWPLYKSLFREPMIRLHFLSQDTTAV